jgi:hypothetical protein
MSRFLQNLDLVNDGGTGERNKFSRRKYGRICLPKDALASARYKGEGRHSLEKTSTVDDN